MQAYFAFPSLQANLRPNEGILIYQSNDNFNDFGYRTLFNFEIFGPEPSTPHSFKLAFTGYEGKLQFELVNTVLTERGVSIAPASEFPQFFSLQFGMEQYRNIVEQYGAETGENILLALNDLVAVRRNLPAPDWVRNATNSEVFTHSLVRTSDSFFAYYNAGSVLSGLENENLHSVDSEFKLNFRLAAFQNDHNFHFKFDTYSLVPKRMAVLIGKNGVGKSQTLNKLIQAAIDGSDRLTGENGERPKISRLIAVSTPGETETTFPPVPRHPTRINYLRLSASPKERADTTGGQTLPEVLVQLARNRSKIGSEYRWNMFEKAISRILPFGDLYIVPSTFPSTQPSNGAVWRLATVCVRELRVSTEKNALDAMRRVDFSGQLVLRIGNDSAPLSSGQLSFVRLAAQLCMYIENGSLILIDEPETHLHPNLVTDLVAMLNEILELAGAIAIIATHSAYLVREVPGSQVHLIREIENRHISVLPPRLKTFGADVGAISSFIFGDDIVNRLIEEVKSRLSKSPDSYVDWKTQLKGELSTEAEMYLTRELDNQKIMPK